MKFYFQSRALFFRYKTTLNRLIELSNLNSMIIQSSRDMHPIFDTQAEDILKANLAVSTLNQQQKNAALKFRRPMNLLSVIRNFYTWSAKIFRRHSPKEKLKPISLFWARQWGNLSIKKHRLVEQHSAWNHDAERRHSEWQPAKLEWKACQHSPAAAAKQLNAPRKQPRAFCYAPRKICSIKAMNFK